MVFPIFSVTPDGDIPTETPFMISCAVPTLPEPSVALMVHAPLTPFDSKSPVCEMLPYTVGGSTHQKYDVVEPPVAVKFKVELYSIVDAAGVTDTMFLLARILDEPRTPLESVQITVVSPGCIGVKTPLSLIEPIPDCDKVHK